MIKILNVQKIMGMHCNGHRVDGVRYSVKENAYIFEFNIPRIKPEPVEVYFRESHYKDVYEIFVMGFHVATVLTLTKKEVMDMGRGASDFSTLLRRCLHKLEHYNNQNNVSF
jgi:hypothetical protein